jgi:hypothetical protein
MVTSTHGIASIKKAFAESYMENVNMNGHVERVRHFEKKHGILQDRTQIISNLDYQLNSMLIKKLKFLKMNKLVDKDKIVKVYKLCTSSDEEIKKMGLAIYTGLINKQLHLDEFLDWRDTKPGFLILSQQKLL